MKTYYYIAKRKPRGRNPIYVGDGLIEANSAKEARDSVAYHCACPKKHIKVKEHPTTH